MYHMKKILSNKIHLFYFFILLIASLSLIFTNVSYDAEYQLAMAYRIVKGDTMIKEMWEPHQTSAFLCAIIMKLFIMVTGSTTGIVLFTQIIGFTIRSLISFYLYKTLRKVTSQAPALIAAILYLIISPKDLLVPEFSNMQLWFGTLMFLFFVHYLHSKKLWLLILSAISLCLGVLSYPSFIVSFIVMCGLLIHYSSNTKRDIILYTTTCAGIGLSYVFYLLCQASWDDIITCLPKALSIEPSHTVDFSTKLLTHALNSCKVLGILIIIALIGWIIHLILSYTLKKLNLPKDNWIFIFWCILMILLLLHILKANSHGGPSYSFLVIMFIGLCKRNLLTKEQKPIFYGASWVGISNLVSTLILSDHAVLQAIPYMILPVCISVIPLYNWFKAEQNKKYWKVFFIICVHTFLLITIFRSLYVHVPISGRSQICSILSDMAIIRRGPAMGIITNESGAAMQRDSMAEWSKYIKENDTIWILGEPVDTLGYLYENVEVGAPSVMSTPTYNSELLYYWEINPEKYPDVIILSSSFGELSWGLLKNEWLMEWIEREYQANTVIDGHYWRYYFKE